MSPQMGDLTPGIKLTLGAYAVAIARPYVALHDRRLVFLDGNEDVGAVDYSVAGNDVIRGSALRFRWAMRAWMTADQWRVMQAIHGYQRQLEERREPFAVLLDDQVREVVDPGDRLRAIVPGTPEITVDGGGTAYFARFWVRLGAPTASPVQNPGFPWLVDWQMSKLRRAAPGEGLA